MNSSEKLTNNPEQKHLPDGLEKARERQQEVLQDRLEEAGGGQHESLDDARREALEVAHSIEKEDTKKHEREQSSVERQPDRPIGKAERDASFIATMQEVRTHMSGPSRTFSKVIHNKTVEKISDVAGNTIARPNAILSGAILAFALTLGVYLVAKNMGYTLSGFETIGAFALGWALGLAYDFLKVMITGRK